MIERAVPVIRAQLVSGEEMLWTGTPRLGLWVRLGTSWYAVVPAALVFLYVTFVVERLPDFIRIPWDALTALSFLGFLAVFAYDVVRRNNAFFGLTDRRALSVYWLFGMRVESVAFGLIDSVTVKKRSDGSGTITFGIPHEPDRQVDAALGDWPLTGPLVFDMIEHVDDVALKIAAARAMQREKIWQAAETSLTPVFAMSEDIKIAYFDVGTGDPIVFLHGVGATKRCWALQLRGLARKFRCIALDYRGYGDSDVPPPETISREAFARDVAAVMDAAGIDKAALCGNSLGGVVALEFYRQFPQRVQSLILVDSFAFYPGGAESMPDRIKTLDELGIEQFAATRSRALFAPDAPELLVERARADLASIPLEVYKASTRVTWSGDYREMLPRIQVGALVLWGEHDKNIAPRALSEELARAIPACIAVTEVPKAGHIPQMENPLAFNALLADYLS